MADETEIYTADHVLEYPFVRSVGPVVGAFLTALRDGTVVGIRGSGGRVIVPPTEYDPVTGEETTEVVEVGPEGTVTAWSWVPRPKAKQPLDSPFAWVLVQFDGADTSFLHVLPASSPEEVSTGMRVRPQFAPDAARVGHVKDIEHFVAVETAS
jgi:uncharacterized OB-fold protein